MEHIETRIENTNNMSVLPDDSGDRKWLVDLPDDCGERMPSFMSQLPDDSGNRMPA